MRGLTIDLLHAHNGKGLGFSADQGLEKLEIQLQIFRFRRHSKLYLPSLSS